MRFLSTLFWLVVAAALVVVGLANRGLVTLRLLPPALEDATGRAWAADLPLFLIIFAALAAGLLLGLVWEWIREIPERARARATAREVERLRAEVSRLGGRVGDTVGDDVLALIEPPRVARR